MKNEMVLLYIATAGISLLVNIASGESPSYIFSNCIALLVILVLQIIKTINIYMNRYNLIISIIEYLLIVIFLFKGQYNIVAILPIIIFELLNKYLNKIVILELISLMINFYFVRVDFINASVFSLLLYLYLFQSKRQLINKNELKKLNKELRDSQFIMKKKMIDLDKYLEQNNVMAILKERNYIAQKLHDHLGHRITSSIMQLEVTKAMIDENKETSIRYLDSAMDNLREGMDEIRLFLKNIKPEEKTITIEDIKEILYKFQYNSGIKTSFEVNGEIERIDSNLLEIFVNNIREALTNCGKYSSATEVQVSFNVYRKIVRVEVSDNGEGCEKIVKGLGLRGIEERLKSVNGQVTYSNNNGFSINMIVSLGV